MRSAKKKLDVISCLTRCESILGDVEEDEEEGRLRLRQRIEREETRDGEREPQREERGTHQVSEEKAQI